MQQPPTTTEFGAFVASDATLRLTKIPVPGNPLAVKSGLQLITTAEAFAQELETSARRTLRNQGVTVRALQLTVGSHQEALAVVAPEHAVELAAHGTIILLNQWRSTVKSLSQTPEPDVPWSVPMRASSAAAADEEPPDVGSRTNNGAPPRPAQKQAANSQEGLHPTASAPPYARGDAMRNHFENFRRSSAGLGCEGATELLEASLQRSIADGSTGAVRVCALVEDEVEGNRLGDVVLRQRTCDVMVVFGVGDQPDAGMTPPDGHSIALAAPLVAAAAPHKARWVLLKTGVFAKVSFGEAKEDPATFAAHPFTCFRLTMKGAGTVGDDDSKFWLVVVTAPGRAPTRGSLPRFVTQSNLPVIIVGLVGSARVLVELCGGVDEIQTSHSAPIAGSPGLCTVIATRGKRVGTPVFPPADGTDLGGGRLYSNAAAPMSPTLPLVVDVGGDEVPDPLRAAARAACLIHRQVKDGHLQVIAERTGDSYDLMPSHVLMSPTAAGSPKQRVIDAALAGLEQVLGTATLTTTTRATLRDAMADAKVVLLGDGTAVVLVDAQLSATFPLQTLPARFNSTVSSPTSFVDPRHRSTVGWCRGPVLAAMVGDPVRQRRVGETLRRAACHRDLGDLFNAAHRTSGEAVDVVASPTECVPLGRDGRLWQRAGIGQTPDERVAAELRRVLPELESVEEQLGQMGLVPDTPDPDFAVISKAGAEGASLLQDLARAGTGEPHAILRVRKSFQTADVIDKLRQGVRKMRKVYHTTGDAATAIAIASAGPDLALASPGGNSGAGFYTTPDLKISKGFGNSTLIIRILQGSSIADIGQGSTQAQRAKLQAAQANSATSAHCNEVVVFDADQLKFDYIVFWKETPEVARIVHENRALAQEAAAARRDFAQRQEKLTERRDLLNAYVNMLHLIATDETTTVAEKLQQLDAEAAELRNPPGIYRIKPDILRDARSHIALVAGGRPAPATGLAMFELQCATGSGKSLYVPQYLAFQVLPARRLPSDRPSRVLVLVPTRMIAEQVSAKAAEMRGTPLGTEVGYSIGGKRRFDVNGAGSTRIVYMTYMLFLKGELQSNPELHGIDAIIFDEAHKAQADVNVAVGLIPVVRRRCPRAMIFVSSATLPDGLVAALGSPHTRRFVLGKRGFPVADGSQPPKDEGEEQDVVTHMLRVVGDVMAQGPNGNLLCFLPNKRTVDEAAKRAQALAGTSVEVMPIHAHSPAADRKRVGEPVDTRKHTCRVIFATSYLDEGITAHNVAHVLDCGRTQTERPSATRDKYEVHVQYVSQHTAIQRRGRTGRTCAGEYVKLYDDKRLRRAPSSVGGGEDDADAIESDGAAMSLAMEWFDWLPTLLALGVRNPATLRFPHQPSHRDLGIAAVRLHQLRLLDAAAASGRLTERGEIVASMPFPTAHSCLVLEAAAFEVDARHGTAWAHAAAVAAAFKVDRLSGRKLFAAAEDAFADLRRRQPAYQSDFAAIADVFSAVVAAELNGRPLPFALDGRHVQDLMLDWDHARVALHYGSPERQRRLLDDLLLRHCRLARGRDELTPLGRYAASACTSPVELRVLLESADVWYPCVEAHVEFTPDDVAALLDVLPATDGQQLVPVNAAAGVLSTEVAIARAAAAVFAQNVAIPNDATTLDVPCVVTNEAMDAALVDNKCFVQRANLPPGKVVLFGRFEHVSDEKGKVTAFLKHVTLADDDGAASLLQVADQLEGVFQGDANGFGNQATAPTLAQFRRRVVLPLPQCEALAPTDKHASKPLQDRLTGKPTAVAVFPHPGRQNTLVAGYSGANLGTEAVLTGALALGCGLFPNLYAALVNPPAAAAIVGGSKRALWQYVIHVLVHTMELTVYGGAVRDFLLRGEDLADIDVSASPTIAAMKPAIIVQAVQWAMAALNAGNAGLRVELAAVQKLPAVRAVVNVTVGPHTAQLEFVDPAKVPTAIDMSCNNVQVCKQGLRLKRGVAGASLALIVWQIRNKKGTILDASETPYQQRRRAKMRQRGWDLWNLSPNNTVNRQARPPPELAARDLDWSAQV